MGLGILRGDVPLHIDRVHLWRAPELAKGRLYAVATDGSNHGSFDIQVVDASGNRYVRVSGYRSVALPDGIDTEPLKGLLAVMA
jgi:hypothetical protein